MLGEPRPEVGPEVARERRLAGRVQTRRPSVPHAAEQLREVAPASSVEQVGSRRVAEDAGRVLGKDAVARERPQQPVERVGVRAGVSCQLGHGPRPVGELVCDAELGDDGQRRVPSAPRKRSHSCDSGEPLAHARAARTAAATASISVVGHRAAVEQQAAVADDADHGRLAESQRRRELLLDGARVALKLRQRERAAADARDGLLHLAADCRGQTLGPRANGVGGLFEHPQHGDLAARAVGVEVERQRAFERGERELVGPQRPLEGVAPQPLHELRPADDDARLRPAQQLVAGEADEAGARGEALARLRLVAERHERARSRGRRRAPGRAPPPRPPAPGASDGR